MTEVIRHKNKYYILASSARLVHETRSLKHGETFAVFDRLGDVHYLRGSELGIFHEGTRHLSHLEFRFFGMTPFLLSSTIKEDNASLVEDLTNPDMEIGGKEFTRGTFHIFRTKLLYEGACYEHLRIRNHSREQLPYSFSFTFDADFVDIFEVRGLKRKRRGELRPPINENGGLVLSYKGLDGVERSTHILFEPSPVTVDGKNVFFEGTIEPKQNLEFELQIYCTSHPPSKVIKFQEAAHKNEADLEAGWTDVASVYTSNEQFNDWVNRSLFDIKMMTTRTESGFYPYAGIPWFSTPFGRDGIITALQTLWVNADLAKGVLTYLAKHQADREDPSSDAQPGKILHETRNGEMAALGEIPFRKYYGSIDSTPLYLILLGAYLRRTADLETVAKLWPHAERALTWIDRYGDVDGDGFVEYSRKSPTGLVHQGWKDSDDSVFHIDGRLAEGPIALCEVQGYVYAARRNAALVADALGKQDVASELRIQASKLKELFEKKFWSEKMGMYLLALDGKKEPCLVRSSNAGQVLFTGIAETNHANQTILQLLNPDFFTGWGIRTIPEGESRYNPMSYHNGSIWPHDTALIAKGFARYGHRTGTEKLLSALFDASIFLDRHRLPELLCGFRRRPGQPPTLYPVACAPQAWASGAVFMLLQSLLGLRFRAGRNSISLIRPSLPESLQEVNLRNLKVRDARIDICFRQHNGDVAVEVQKKEGTIAVEIEK